VEGVSGGGIPRSDPISEAPGSLKEPRADEAGPGVEAPGSGEADELAVDDYDYHLPPERVAQEPITPRDSSLLMVLDRRSNSARHLQFRQLPEILSPGDLLVLNDTRVFRARLKGRKPTGGWVEFLFLSAGRGGSTWEALCDCTRELRAGTRIDFGERIEAEVQGRLGDRVLLGFPAGSDLEEMLDRRGSVPLPPYIRRASGDPRKGADADRYQTIYARHRGAVAAPTAGLHFTPKLFRRLGARGIRFSFLTLHVGPGTFLPIREGDARRHRLHPESFHLPAATAAAVQAARRENRRVVAVGTTVARVLEFQAGQGEIREQAGECDLYLLPGHRFLCVDALITNFHLPRSTLLLLVAAFAGRDRILSAYREAVARKYRFYSYGDAMLIL